MGKYSVWAALAGLGAAILFILGVAVFYGYIPSSLVGNFTATELGVFGFLFAAAAVALEVIGER